MLPQFRLPHPVRLYHPSSLQPAISPNNNNLSLLRLFVSKVQISKHSPHPLIPGINLQSSDMCVFPVLMVLHDSNLDKKSSERLAVFAASNMIEWNVDPTFRLRELEGGEGDEVVVACAGEESDTCRSVRFVSFEVEENAY